MLNRKQVDNDIYDLSKDFAIRIVNMYNYLRSEKKEMVMSKQILRSGTSIGANVREGKYAQSRADFINKMNIALKEASESAIGLKYCIRQNTLLTLYTNQCMKIVIKLLLS
jgi:four helix bundle protein